MSSQISARRLYGRSGSIRRSGRDERGAYAVLFSMMIVLVVALAAIGVDIASNVAAKQELRDTVDMAAHAGALALPASTTSVQSVVSSTAQANDPESHVTTDLWCVVAAVGTPSVPNYTQIPSTCKPHGTKPYAGAKCTTELCFIPCIPSATDSTIKCNTVRVADSKVVPYAFAPAIGFKEGNTGALISVACKGSCGTAAPNPLDVVVVADRTLSLSSGDRTAMKNAIKAMTLQMDPTMHFLALGTIHKSEPTSSCASAAGSVTLGRDQDEPTATEMSRGVWVPTDFSRDYVTGDAGSRSYKTTDPVYKAINCLNSSDQDYGTHLAAPMKEAARKLLGLSASNLGGLTSANPREGEIRKVIIFETDGQPNEQRTLTGSTSVTTAGELRSTNGTTACKNLLDVATSAKDNKILIITIGFGGATSARCSGSSGSFTRDVLAAAASPHPGTGAPSASNTCRNADIDIENSDGDYFFCAVDGSEFEEIFRTAFGQLSKGVRFLKMPD